MDTKEKIIINGAGPVGLFLALLLKKRGYAPIVFEKRSFEETSSGRSINLILTSRGLSSLKKVFDLKDILKFTVPVYGREIHHTSGKSTFRPYGNNQTERNFSISRTQINSLLLENTLSEKIPVNFSHNLINVDFNLKKASFEHLNQNHNFEYDRIFGADGIHSNLRGSILKYHNLINQIHYLDIGYKELLLPAQSNNKYQLNPKALHIWPRAHFMLMALANQDGSFTLTLYLPLNGKDSFNKIQTPEQLNSFFKNNFADVLPLLPNLADEFFTNPTGRLGSLFSPEWTVNEQALLFGDAAHAMVPFFGQGLNAGLEDCQYFDENVIQNNMSIKDYHFTRKINTDAITKMALENYTEMMVQTGDSSYIAKKLLEEKIENQFSDKYRSRYSIVTYSLIPYKHAQNLGELQGKILDTLHNNSTSPHQFDSNLAQKLIEKHITPYIQKHDIDLDFSLQKIDPFLS